MLSGRSSFSLRLQRFELVDEHLPRLARLDHIIEVSTFRGDVRVGELLPVRLNQFLSLGFRVFRLCQFFPEYDVDRSLWTHYRDLGRRPGKISVCSNMLAS